MTEKRNVWITIHGERREVPYGTCILQLVDEYQPEYKNDIVIAVVNGKLQELSGRCVNDCTIEFITTGEPIGKQVYERSVIFLMLKAIQDVAGKDRVGKLCVEFSFRQGVYCLLEDCVEPSPKFLEAVEARMRQLCREERPILKSTMSTEEAVKKYRDRGFLDKANLFTYRKASLVNVYWLDGFENYFYGYMVPSTKYLKYFAFHPYGDGFVLQLPTLEEPKMIPPFVPHGKLFQIEAKSTKWSNMLGIDTVASLNDRIKAGKFKELMLVQEALQEKELADIAREIYNSKKKLVLIAGPSSSGKTTFCQRLAIQLRIYGLIPHTISVDDYFVDRDKTPLDANGEHDFESLKAIDVKQFNEDMGRLLEGRVVQLPTYNFVTGKREYRKQNVLQIGQTDIVLIEGIHCLNEKLTSRLPKSNKYKVYVSALTTLNIDEHNRVPTTDARLLRRMVRDARTRGTDAKETIARWPSVRRGEEKNIFPYQEEADVMFNSALVYELAVLKQYAEPVLHGIAKEEKEYLEAKRLLKFLDYFIGVGSEIVPNNSILREFIGESIFEK